MPCRRSRSRSRSRGRLPRRDSRAVRAGKPARSPRTDDPQPRGSRQASADSALGGGTIESDRSSVRRPRLRPARSRLVTRSPPFWSAVSRRRRPPKRAPSRLPLAASGKTASTDADPRDKGSEVTRDAVVGMDLDHRAARPARHGRRRLRPALASERRPGRGRQPASSAFTALRPLTRQPRGTLSTRVDKTSSSSRRAP